MSRRAQLGADAVDVLKAGFTGFVTYIVPMALFRGGKLSESVVRSAGAFAVFTASYRGLRAVMRQMTHANGPTVVPPHVVDVMDKWSPAIAGALAATLGNAYDSNAWSGSIFVIWLFLRAVRMHLPSGESIPWAAPAIMVAAVEIISPSGFCSVGENHSSYQQFLDSFAVDLGVNVAVMRNPPPGKCIGDAIHRSSSDNAFFLFHVLPNLLVKTCRVYWPLHALAASLRLFTHGSLDLKALAENILRSTAFLTGWVGTLWFFVLHHSRLLGRGVERRHVSMWAWLGGLWILCERPSRQVELASYCASHAINSLYNRYKMAGIIKPSDTVGSALLAISAAILMNSFSNSPSWATRRLFGEDV